MKNVTTSLNSLNSKVDKIEVDKSVPFSVDLSKLNDVLKNDVVKKDVYYAKMKDSENRKINITDLATNATLNAKINEVKNKIPNITILATNTAPTAVGNKTPNISNLTKKLFFFRNIFKLLRIYTR